MQPISDVFNIDCLDYMRGLPDNAFELVIADPPYGDAGSGTLGASGQHKHIKLDSTSKKDRMFKYRKLPPPQQLNHATGGRFERYEGAGVKCTDWDVAPKREFFDELFRVANTVVIWGGNYFQLPATRCFLVWDKQQPEDFSMAMCEYAWTNMNANAKMFRMKPMGTPKDPRFHPTQKPVELYAWIIRNYAKSGDRIFDPMMGSQSSRIAAYKMGFDYVGCELDKEYFDKGCERFERECLGIIKTSGGHTVTQQSLFKF